VYSYQIKDDKKITSTPLLEIIAAAKEEKREAKVSCNHERICKSKIHNFFIQKKKIEEKKKAREEEKQKKKLQIAKNVPEPIKEKPEAKEEVIYEDGFMVRTVPSRIGRNDKNSRKDEEKEKRK
jgi:hypothetical protein